MSEKKPKKSQGSGLKTHFASYYDFDPAEVRSCPRCEWSGTASQAGIEVLEELSTYHCPGCEATLCLVPHPYSGDAGVEEAERFGTSADVQSAKSSRDRQKRAEASELKSAAELPDIESDDIVIEWDYEHAPDDESCTVLRHDGDEIFRELAYFEGYPRFAAVAEILLEKYGRRLSAFAPTERSTTYLYGDDFRSIGVVKDVRERIAYQHEHGEDPPETARDESKVRELAKKRKAKPAKRIKLDPNFDASEGWSEFDDRIVEDTQEGRVTTWFGHLGGVVGDSDDDEL